MKQVFSVALFLCVIPFPPSTSFPFSPSTPLPFAQSPPSSSLPPWTPGTLDFHQISTGRGNAALVVFPDATTLLIDAGAAGGGAAMAGTHPRPDAPRTPGAGIAGYLSQQNVTRPPFVLLTPFHVDHNRRLSAVPPPLPVGL